MKFQKGLLDELKHPKGAIDERPPKQNSHSKESLVDDSDRLFQSHRSTARSWQRYLKLLGIVALFVVIGGSLFFYLTLPRFGDRVRAPRGLENAVRSHFLDVEKRTTGEISFYYCENFYWARVEVEKRPDIKTNPVYQIGTYIARATQTAESAWSVAAAPLTSPAADIPCE